MGTDKIPQALETLQQSFRQAMRGFAGAVSVVTVADPLDARERSGFTATSVSSFSATPPMVVASMKATSSVSAARRPVLRAPAGPGSPALARRASAPAPSPASVIPRVLASQANPLTHGSSDPASTAAFP